MHIHKEWWDWPLVFFLLLLSLVRSCFGLWRPQRIYGSIIKRTEPGKGETFLRVLWPFEPSLSDYTSKKPLYRSDPMSFPDWSTSLLLWLVLTPDRTTAIIAVKHRLRENVGSFWTVRTSETLTDVNTEHVIHHSGEEQQPATVSLSLLASLFFIISHLLQAASLLRAETVRQGNSSRPRAVWAQRRDFCEGFRPAVVKLFNNSPFQILFGVSYYPLHVSVR